MNRRAFAMPIVIILSLVVGIVAAVLLERQTAQALTVHRELNNYRDHHFKRGVQEIAGAWTDTLAGQPIANMIAEDGHFMDVQAGDGTFLAAYLFDGQGSALMDPTGLTEEERTDAGGILQELALLVGNNPDPSLLRSVGPVKICVASAAPELLEAVGNYATGSRNGRRFADSLTRARARAPLTPADLDTAQGEASMTPEQRQVLQRLVTVSPELWMMVIDVYKPGEGSIPGVRYGGLFSPPGSGSRAANTLRSLGKFLSFEELPVSGRPGQ
jgi:hypothetical protein